MDPSQPSDKTECKSSSPPLVTWGVRASGALAVLIGAFWLSAWFAGWAANWSAAGVITVKTNMALCQIGAGISLLLLGPAVLSRRRRTGGMAFAVFVLLISALTLVEHLFGRDFGIDQFLAAEAPGAVAVTSPNRMGPLGSTTLVLVGAGLLTLALKRRAIAPYFGLAACVINLVPAFGFLYHITGFYSQPGLTGIAWPTVIALSALGVGLMLAHANLGPASLLLRPDAGGRILRRMLPAVILIPAILGYLRTQGQIKGLYDSATGTGLLAIALILAFSLILWRSAALLSKSACAEAMAQQYVRENEARLSHAQKIANIGCWEWDIRTGGLSWSDQIYRQLGLQPGTVPPDFSTFKQSVHVEDRAKFAAAIERALANESLYELEFRILRPDGEIRMLHARGEVLHGPDKSPQRMIGISFDITERKRTEEALRVQDLQRQQILNATPFMFVRCTAELCYSYVSRSHARLVGYAQEEIVGKPIAEILGEAAFRKVRPYLERVLQGETVQYELELQLQKGGAHFLSVNYVPEINERGAVVGFIGSMVDITERKLAEQALRESQKQLVSDMDAMTRLQKLGMLLVDEETLELVLGEILDAAIAICRADFGNIQILDPGTSQLRIAAQRRFPDWWIDFWNGVTEGRGVCGTALKIGERIYVEDVENSPIFAGTAALEMQLKAGVRAVQSTPLFSRSGVLVGVFSTHYKTRHRPDDRELRMLDLLARHAADIITRAQGEAELRQTNAALEEKVKERTAELAKRAFQLRALAGKLAVSEQRERRRMAKVMHDHLQQILVGAKFHVAILGRCGDELVRKEAEEVEHLLDESILTSRSLTAQLSPPILQDAGLGAGLEWLVRWMADRHGLKVELKGEEDIPPLAEDVRILLFESTKELLFNTVKHARANAAVVEVRRVGAERLRVAVSDDGLGFEPAQIAMAGETKAAFGLFGIREQVELFGGQMEIDSAPGHGSRFVLCVPIVTDEAPAEAVTEPKVIAEEARAAEEAPPGNESQIRIVLADDHVVMRQGLAQLLGQETDFQIVGEAADGQEAVELAGRLLPDIILMDMSMPKLSGLEATRVIHGEHPEIRILGLSMFEDAQRARDMCNAGAVAYLVKSGPSADLITAIRSSMAKPGPERVPV